MDSPTKAGRNEADTAQRLALLACSHNANFTVYRMDINELGALDFWEYWRQSADKRVVGGSAGEDEL